MGPAEFEACECSAHYRRTQGEPDAPHTPGCPADGLEWPLTFSLTITLGEDGQDSLIADVLHDLAIDFRPFSYIEGSGDIEDHEGAKVGNWSVQ